VNAEGRPASSREPAKGGDRFVRGVVVLVIAAGGGYALMTALKDKLGPPEAVQPSSSIPAVPVEKAEPSVVEPTPSAVLSAPVETASPSPSAAPAGSRGFWPVQDLELPVDVSVLPDRGLLEIDVSAPHSIYVDGVFIGRGPARRIPLREGSHEVRVRGDGIDAVQAVEVKKGRRARLGPTNVQ
jgi:hypothetical protein